MRQYKWNKYGFKISLKLEVPDKYIGVFRGKLDKDKIWKFDYLGDWEKLYSNDQAFMYPSLFTYFMNDLEDILCWYNTEKKYERNLR